MASRPSPFKSRSSAILNFKNGPCILSARNTCLPSGRSSRGLLYFHPRSGCTLNSRSGPQGAAECIVYAAIRETYCRPANNERFPRGRSTPSLFSPLSWRVYRLLPTWWPSPVSRILFPRLRRRNWNETRKSRLRVSPSNILARHRDARPPT